ncbi:MAG: hypothetical protein Q4F99_07370, partial [bacterium]|nr:hypothetical protein [bacterium]
VSEGRRLRDALRHERAEHVEVHTHTELIMVDINPEEGVIFLHVKGYRLHQPEEDVHWFVCVDKKVTEIKPLFVKKNGREAMISLPTEIYPVGTSLSLSMRLYKGKNRFAEFVYPEIIEL